MIAGGLFLCSWVLVIGPVISDSTDPVLSQVVNLAYPVLDAVGLAAVLFVALRRRDDPPAGLGLLGLGIACVAVSDIAFWYLGATLPQFPGVTPLDSGWVAGFGLIALAALAPLGVHRRRAGWVGGRLVLVAPALPAVIGVGIVVAKWQAGGDLNPLGALIVVLAALLIIAVVLQLVATYENRRLANDLSGACSSAPRSCTPPSATTARSCSTPRTRSWSSTQTFKSVMHPIRCWTHWVAQRIG